MFVHTHIDSISTSTDDNTSVRTSLDDIPRDSMSKIGIIHGIRCIATMINNLNTLIFKVF